MPWRDFVSECSVIASGVCGGGGGCWYKLFSFSVANAAMAMARWSVIAFCNCVTSNWRRSSAVSFMAACIYCLVVLMTRSSWMSAIS